MHFPRLWIPPLLSRAALAMVLIHLVPGALAQDYLLIPDSTTDRVSAFSPFDGSIVNLDFIPNDGHLSTPIAAIPSGRGTIFVSDQIADAVFEYGLDGAYIGTIADNGVGLDNVRGIAVSNNWLYVTVGSGALTDTVQRFDLNGGNQSTFATVSNPFDVYFRENDVLVSNIDDDNIDSFDFDGNYNGPFHDSDGNTGVDFPEQINRRSNGNVIVAGFSTPAGIFEYDTLGNELNYYSVSTGLRGVYELGNGNYLWTNGSGVQTFNPSTGEVALVTAGSYRFIHAVPEPGTLALLLIGAGCAIRRRRTA